MIGNLKGHEEIQFSPSWSTRGGGDLFIFQSASSPIPPPSNIPDDEPQDPRVDGEEAAPGAPQPGHEGAAAVEFELVRLLEPDRLRFVFRVGLERKGGGGGRERGEGRGRRGNWKGDYLGENPEGRGEEAEAGGGEKGGVREVEW